MHWKVSGQYNKIKKMEKVGGALPPSSYGGASSGPERCITLYLIDQASFVARTCINNYRAGSDIKQTQNAADAYIVCEI